MNELLAPEDVAQEAAGAQLLALLERSGDGLGVHDRGVHQADRAFYDTFDGRLHGAGLSAVHEDGKLALLDRDSGARRATAAAPRPEQPLLAGGLAPGPLRERLADVVDVRALLPLARVTSTVRRLDVLDDERKTVVRISLEQPTLVSDGERTPLRARLRLGPVRGYDAELERVRQTLSDELSYQVADEPLVDEALAAAGRSPAGVSKKISVRLGPEQRADAAVAAVLRALLEVIRANLDGAVGDLDSEFLHDFRVSIRRSRAVQRQLRRVFPPGPLAQFREEFRALQRATGDARDLDVYVLEFDSIGSFVGEQLRPDLEAVLEVLRGRRDEAHRELARTLRSEQTAGLLKRWSELLERLEAASEVDRPDAERPIARVAGGRIVKVYRQMRKLGGTIGPSSPAEDYHELRKKGKELRYLLELFGAELYPDKVVAPMIKRLKNLQDVLGRHQDRVVQIAMLRDIRDEVGAKPDGAAALMAMGVLVERLGEDERRARAQFAAAFAAFASRSQRRAVKDTFA